MLPQVTRAKLCPPPPPSQDEDKKAPTTQDRHPEDDRKSHLQDAGAQWVSADLGSQCHSVLPTEGEGAPGRRGFLR